MLATSRPQFLNSEMGEPHKVITDVLKVFIGWESVDSFGTKLQQCVQSCKERGEKLTFLSFFEFIQQLCMERGSQFFGLSSEENRHTCLPAWRFRSVQGADPKEGE